ncbi:MAG: hypothetical protein HYW71_00720 [Candidatus Niyogibacteria bacterium]|nr:hypothetical protein [Candidatus Niyogibacteria bacterium]
MESEKNFKNSESGRIKTEKEKMIEKGIITPEEPEKELSFNIPEKDIKKEELSFDVSKEPEKIIEKELSFDVSVKEKVSERTKEESRLGKDETLTLYRLLRGKGENAEEVPADFKLPAEMEKNAADFFKTRTRYVEEWDKHQQTLKTLEKSKGKEGDIEYIDARRYLENADASYKLALERLKRDVVGYKYREKIKEFPEAAAKIGKKKEYAAASASVMVGIAKLINADLEKIKMEKMSERNEQEKGRMRKLWDKYTGLSRGKRLFLSAGLSAGFAGAGIAFALGPGGWLLAAGVAGHRGLRTLGGGAIASGLNALGRKIFGSKFGKERMESLTQETGAIEKEILVEIENQRKLPKSEKNKWRMMEIIDCHSDEYDKKLKDIGRREGKTNMIIALASGLIGGISAAGLDWYFSRPKVSEVAELAEIKKGAAPIEPNGLKVESEISAVKEAAEISQLKEIAPLKIGVRGPEGAIIDYFKGNPEMAKKFGWDGIKDLKDWSGIKAHQLWFEDAQEALKNQEILNKLKSLGYSQDIEGYGQMMRRIGKGFVELDPKTGKMDLADSAEYLKAVKGAGTSVESGLLAENGMSGIETAQSVKPRFNPEEAAVRHAGDQRELEHYITGQEGGLKPPAEIETDGVSSSREMPGFIQKAGSELSPLNPMEISSADKQAVDLIGQIKSGELTVDKFSADYAKELGGTKGMSPELKDNLAKTFEALKSSDPMKRLNSEVIFKAMMRKLMAIRKTFRNI